MIRVALFDADGVIIDPNGFSKRLKQDFNVTREQTSAFFDHEFQPCLVGQADLKVEIAPYLSGWGWNQSVDELLDYWFKAEHAIIPEMPRHIERIRGKGVRCYLVTNQEKYRTAYMRKEMGFENLFDRVFASCEIGKLKSDPKFFEIVLSEFPGVTAEEICYWDDNQEPVAMAKSLGLQARFFTKIADFEKDLTALELAK